MNWRQEGGKLTAILAVFLACYFLPVGWGRFDQAVGEGLGLVRWYAREHVLAFVLPACLIGGGIAVFLRGPSILRFLGPGAKRLYAYLAASVAGGVLAACSCMVLPMFAGIYRMGAGLGPAATFLYTGPAINVLAVLLTWYLLGWELGLARGIGAMAVGVVIGLLMSAIFRKDEARRSVQAAVVPETAAAYPIWKGAAAIACMIAAVVLAGRAAGGEFRFGVRCCPTGKVTEQIEARVLARQGADVLLRDAAGAERTVPLSLIGSQQPVGGGRSVAALVAAGVLVAALIAMLVRWFPRRDVLEWAGASWDFAKQILPLLLAGVLLTGFLLGNPQRGAEGMVPSQWVQAAVGGNSPRANALAAVVGALMYFATLTEAPIVMNLMAAGMGKGPALALLLAGPALSLPSMLVIRSILGTRKALVYILLVVLLATICGMTYGALPG